MPGAPWGDPAGSEMSKPVILSGTKWSRRICALSWVLSRIGGAKILRLALLAQDDKDWWRVRIRQGVVRNDGGYCTPHQSRCARQLPLKGKPWADEGIGPYGCGEMGVGTIF